MLAWHSSVFLEIKIWGNNCFSLLVSFCAHTRLAVSTLDRNRFLSWKSFHWRYHWRFLLCSIVGGKKGWCHSYFLYYIFASFDFMFLSLCYHLLYSDGFVLVVSLVSLALLCTSYVYLGFQIFSDNLDFSEE